MDTPTGDAIAAERPATSPTGTPCIPTELSPAAVELVRLYEELHTFKDDPEFLFFGFTRGPYSAWMQAIETQRDTNPGVELLDEVGFLPGELMMLGMNYMDEDFSDSELAAIEHVEGKIQAGWLLLDAMSWARCRKQYRPLPRLDNAMRRKPKRNSWRESLDNKRLMPTPGWRRGVRIYSAVVQLWRSTCPQSQGRRRLSTDLLMTSWPGKVLWARFAGRRYAWNGL